MYENKRGTSKTRKVEQEVGKSQQSIKTIGQKKDGLQIDVSKIKTGV